MFQPLPLLPPLLYPTASPSTKPEPYSLSLESVVNAVVEAAQTKLAKGTKFLRKELDDQLAPLVKEWEKLNKGQRAVRAEGGLGEGVW